jgi:DNA-binding NarL/FixJ family response regulator
MSSSTSPVTIILADDHELFRDGFKAMLRRRREMQFIGEAANGKELLERVATEKPRIVVTDIQMPVMDGIEATRYLKANYANLGVIILSMYEEESLIRDALLAGANGYLSKQASKEEIVAAIREVNAGGSYFCNAIARKVQRELEEQQNDRATGKVSFTPREEQIIRLLCEELSNKGIALRLQMSQRTVEEHRKHIQDKIGAKNLAGIVLYAIKHKLVKMKR